MALHEYEVQKSGPGSHCAWKIFLIIFHAITLVMTLAFNYMSSPAFYVPALYNSDTGTISDKYDTKITPAGWTFTIWAFIYTWQLIHVIYSLTLLCRKTPDGHYLYVYPGHIHYAYYITYIINMILNTSWIFLFDREMMEVAFVFLFFISFTIYVCGVILCKRLDDTATELERIGNRRDIWLTRILTINGLAFYGTWCTIATLLNFGIVLVYSASVDKTTAAWVCLALLTVEVNVWIVLETFVFDRYLRYVFSPYIVLIVAFSGLLSEHWNPQAPEAYEQFAIFLLSWSLLFAVIKVVIMIVKGIKNPIVYNNVLPESSVAMQKA